jgi:hypothetical protein
MARHNALHLRSGAIFDIGVRLGQREPLSYCRELKLRRTPYPEWKGE